MRKRSSKEKEALDVNELAFDIAQDVTSQGRRPGKAAKKNPAAVALGRLGGLKGGKARAKKLSAKKRQDIAKKAAEARWSTR